MEVATNPRRWRLWAAGAVLVGCGVLAGGVTAATLTASADASAGDDASSTQARDDWATSKGSIHPGESLLTGETARKVEAAVLAAYPNATIVRTESDGDGVYESHITTSDGESLAVEVDKSFAVTGTESGGPGGPPRGDSPDADGT